MTATAALQDWLALEHEAVWLYPVIGARFEGLAEDARQSFATHRVLRDRLINRLHDLDVEPVPTSISYDVGRLKTPSQARLAARRLERRIAAACLTLAGQSTGDFRAYAIKGLQRASLAELAWQGRPSAFPGLS